MTDLALLGGRPVSRESISFRWPPISSSSRQRVDSMLQRGEISYYGRQGAVAEFESLCRDEFEADHVLAVASGTAALHSAFFAAELGPGDEVIVPTFTFLATAMPLFTVGATPILADSSPGTCNLDPKQLPDLLTERTKAVVVTHMFGHPCDMDEIVTFVRDNGLLLIEDCSHAHGARYRGRQVGTFGDLSVYSMGAQKIISGGLGGILVSRTVPLHERAVLFGHFNARALDEVTLPDLQEFAYTGLGLNYRMHPLSAALLLGQLPQMHEMIEHRRENLTYLTDLLSDIDELDLPATSPDCDRGAWYGYYPMLRDPSRLPRAALIAAMVAEGCPTRVPQYKPLHMCSVFQQGTYYAAQVPTVYQEGDLPVSTHDWSRSFPVPTFTAPTDRWKVEAYSEALHKVFAHCDELVNAWYRERGVQ